MIGQIHIKRAVKCSAGWAAVVSARFAPAKSVPHACVFVYHRVATVDFVDSRLDDWNVRPNVFERQLAALSQFGEIVPLHELPEKLNETPGARRPYICLTFDDGFANFHRQVLPLLRRYSVPATVFMPTSAINLTGPMEFDRWAVKNRNRVSDEAWRAMNWEELEECLSSGLVSVGSHSHWHRNGRDCRSEELAEEAIRSREILASRLGDENVKCYAYPYGSSRLGQVTAEYENAVREAGYQLAVSTDLGLATADSNRFLLPRVEAHPLDSAAILRAKASGSLAPYFLTDRLRKARRS